VLAWLVRFGRGRGGRAGRPATGPPTPPRRRRRPPARRGGVHRLKLLQSSPGPAQRSPPVTHRRRSRQARILDPAPYRISCSPKVACQPPTTEPPSVGMSNPPPRRGRHPIQRRVCTPNRRLDGCSNILLRSPGAHPDHEWPPTPHPKPDPARCATTTPRCAGGAPRSGWSVSAMRRPRCPVTRGPPPPTRHHPKSSRCPAPVPVSDAPGVGPAPSPR